MRTQRLEHKSPVEKSPDEDSLMRETLFIVLLNFPSIEFCAHTCVAALCHLHKDLESSTEAVASLSVIHVHLSRVV